MSVRDSVHLHVDPKIVSEVNTGEHHVSFRTSTFYINNSNEDLCVIHRNNLPIKITKSSSDFYLGGPSLTIRTLYHFGTREQIISTINHLQKVKEASKMVQPELNIILDSLLRMFNSNTGVSFHTVGIDRTVPLKDIKQNTSVYVDEADVLLCQFKSYNHLSHPFSQEGIALGAYRRLATESKITGVFIELIDNESQIDNRYFHVAKDVMAVPARKDRSRKSGAYFSKVSCNNYDEITSSVEFMTFEQAESTIGLYKTQHEALTNGNPELILKARQEEQKLRITQLENDLELSRQGNLRIKEELDIEKAKRTDENDRKKLERQDFYESRMYARKDESELIKTIGTVAVTAVTVAAIVLKATSGKNG